MAQETKKRVGWRYGFAIFLIIAGLLLTYLHVGEQFLGFSSVGAWLVYIGFIMLAVITLQLMFRQRRLVDERMEFVASRAARITFIAVILAAFIVMIVDGIHPITLPYSMFMSYFITGIVFIYFVSYRILLRYH